MLIPKQAPFPAGFTAITEIDGAYSEMLIGFGILRLGEGDVYTDPPAGELPESSYKSTERAFLLIHGRAELRWAGVSRTVDRTSMTKEMPSVLHVPSGVPVEIYGLDGGAEFSLHKVLNDQPFEPRFLTGGDIKKVVLASGSVAGETKRELRIAADDDISPFSEMTFGEVLNFPGKWSSYPPHHHPHPEIYHYRFEPENGFGYAEEGGDVHRVTTGDTLLVAPHKVHPQTAAPGYAMIYIWTMPHLKGNRFGKDTRKFEPEHAWVLD